MFDSVGKPGTGMANANINWVGSYKQCRKISVVNKTSEGLPGYSGTFKGRYCRATLGFPPGVPKPVSFQQKYNFSNIILEICIPYDRVASHSVIM